MSIKPIFSLSIFVGILRRDRKKMADKKDKLLVAAIDFGTTHSG